MIVRAPGKVNLYLEVLGRRPDGYHEINTVFEKISLADVLEVERSDKAGSIACDCVEVPVGEDSLLSRTVRLFTDKMGDRSLGFSIHLTKNIPVSAGLGGGSSDAAALLKAMWSLTGEALDWDVILEAGAELGCDVPFFLSSARFALGTGRGDIIRVLPSQGEVSQIIMNPPFGILSGDVYNAWDRLNLTKKSTIDRIMSVFHGHGKELGISADDLRNDLQTVVLQKFPVIQEALDELLGTGAIVSLVSGSGPSVFGIFPAKDIPAAYRKLQTSRFVKDGWELFAAETW